MKIGTHDGVFHCDEVLACFMLKQLPEYKDAEIVRSRDPEKLSTCDIVVDVGAEFDHQKKRYDHHQREFKETLSTLRPELGDKYKIKLSSAGLVYTFYGEDVLKQLAPKGHLLTSEDLRLIYKKVYENIVEEMDAIDNGVPMTDDKPRYKIRTHLSARVHRLNPEWNSQSNSNVDEIFVKAMALVSEEFLYTVNYFISVWLPARDYVKSALEERSEVHESGEIVVFKERFPWKEHLFDLEQELGLVGEIKFAIFNDKIDSWRVQAVPVEPNSFVTRKPLNKSWWGVRDDQLSKAAGIKGCIFCHSTGFIGGNTTKTGALAMAINSLNAV
ncbi:jg1478 [Pararge aegeria aegeria]|uniref:Jg1478 protein n=1 Tax=Pararge aegeria aegeria TaxID=348720 RepID=A0A8S4RKM6_9NEOP|nr:jg1478 [Pararge aegeria aegeria]